MAFPSHTEAQGTQASSLIVMGKVIGYKTKVKSSADIPGTKIAACSPALTLSQGKESSGYRQSCSRAHVQTLGKPAPGTAVSESKPRHSCHDRLQTTQWVRSQAATEPRTSITPVTAKKKNLILLLLMFGAGDLLGTAGSRGERRRQTPTEGIELLGPAAASLGAVVPCPPRRLCPAPQPWSCGQHWDTSRAWLSGH